MVAQKGRDMLVKVNGGSGYVTVAGLRARKVSFNAQAVDVTDAESSGRWRELLGGAGVQRASISGGGIFKDQSSDATLRTAFFAGTILTLQLVIPAFGTLEGPFQVTALDYSGRHDGEVQFEMALESAGALTFTVL
ncbi:phage major tail protein, TP901-1 family [Rhizobium sp. RU20A]|uniref:phage major tail protein, TP901-1 family n=1 Tax=Rhizobium sp. RU20A TaxID=1907412 RepID=UPI00095553A2|nr:phage major tail protein, TP901-1 family [Rhizobium sp. RU20A]SIR15752.1 phage major tail protein, TP901-1 family [Rhizobium sp. RU20A]